MFNERDKIKFLISSDSVFELFIDCLIILCAYLIYFTFSFAYLYQYACMSISQ